MTPRAFFSLVITGILLVITVISVSVFLGHNDDNNWQMQQSPGGEVSVRDGAGYYNKDLSTITTYSRAFLMEWGPIGVTFNDGGTADIHGTALIRTPTLEAERRLMHRDFSADETMRNAKRAIESHLINTLKVTGPVMSGSEHQSARKGEFYALVRSQLEDGLYQTEKIEVELKDQFDDSGNPITVYATKVILGNNGLPLIGEVSPLIQYGFDVSQFSIEDTDYDEKTRELFASKKESLLNAEKSKAAREEEVQERLMIVERGLKEKAEVSAAANKEMERLTIEGKTRVAVANQAALEAAEMKQQQTTEAEARRDVAALDLEVARLAAEGVIVTAAAEEERITKAGAITEQERVLAELDRDTAIGVARELANVKVPSFMIMGGDGGGAGGNLGNLLNVFMMRQLGVFDPSDLE